MPDGNFDFEAVTKAVDEVNRGFEEFKATHKEQLDSLLKKEDVDPLIEEKLQRIDEDLQKKQEIIDKMHLATKRKTIFLDGKEVDQDELDVKAYNWASVASQFRKGKTMPETFGHEDAIAYKKAFEKFVREGKDELDADEKKALSVGSDPDGGYVVDPDTSGRLVQLLFETSPVRSWASVQLISTDALEGIADLDEASSGWVSETGTRSETDTPELDRWRIPVHEQYAEPRATQQLLDDAMIDMEGWLAGKIADKLSRTENAAFVTGNGVGKPRGFMTYDDWTTAGTFEYGKVEQFDTGVAGGFVADPSGIDTFIRALYALKGPYRQRAAWFMNRSTLSVVRRMQDSNGNYHWQPSVQAGEPSSLLGYPVAEFEDMADVADDALVVAVGDMAAAYQIVDRMGIRVLRDPYTAKPYVKFYTTKRVGGDVIDFDALKIIKLAD